METDPGSTIYMLQQIIKTIGVSAETSSVVGQLVMIVILTLINAFFAGAEMAIVSVNKTKIKNLADDGNKSARSLQMMLSEPTNFLSTIQVAITLAGFLNSASAATGLSEQTTALLVAMKIPVVVASTIAVPLITVILSYITLVFGELVPKRVALNNAEKLSLAVIQPIYLLSKIMSPFVKFLSFSTNLVLRILGLDAEGLQEKITEEEIRSLVAEGEEFGVFNETEKDMIENIFLFDDKLAKEIMTPRTDVYMIDINEPQEEFLAELVNCPYSRIPIYEDDIDNIIGILYIKDFFKSAFRRGFENVNIRKIMKKPYFVPERKNIDVLFKELKESKLHISILLDEYGGFSGIVTIEDMIEEVMGEIEDEYDTRNPEYWKIDDKRFGVKGLMTISDLNAALDLDFDTTSEEYDTIGGYLIHHLGHIPAEDGEMESIDLDGCTFKITSVKENRIDEIELTIHPVFLTIGEEE